MQSLYRLNSTSMLTSFRIINGVAFFGTLFFYFPKRTHDGPKKSDIFKRVDYLGAILSIVGLTLLYV
jgi:hypothetical protein